MPSLSEPPPDNALQSKWSTLICWIVITGFVIFSLSVQSSSARRNAAAAAVSDSTPNIGIAVAGRLAIAQANLIASDGSPAGKTRDETLRHQLKANIEQLAVSPLDKLVAVVVIRELLGAEQAINELDSSESIITGSQKLSPDVTAIRSIYTTGPQSLSATSRVVLIDHLGWFGKLAATQGLPDTNPERAILLQAVHQSFVVTAGLVIALMGGFGIGFLLLILMIVLFALGKWRFTFQPDSLPGPPVFLETFALWAVAFVGLSSALGRWRPHHSTLIFEMLFAIVSIAICLWPMYRGMPWPVVRHSLGWHRGKGVFTEMGAGIAGYIAGLPIIGLGVLITLVLTRLTHGNPTHPITQDLTGDLPISKIIALLITVSVAAPFLEETLFRGALYFHLRRRWRPGLSATIVAIIFAAIHPQGWTAIPVLGSIAIVLAMLREWRGSLLASMTAHGINNAMVLVAIVSVLR